MDNYNNSFNDCVKKLQNSIQCIQQYSNIEEHLPVIKEITKNYCESDIEYSKHLEAYKQTTECLRTATASTDTDVKELYNNFLENQPDKLYEDHSIWNKLIGTGFSHDTNDVEMDEDGLLTCTELEEDNVSIVMTNEISSDFEPPIDPFTKQPIKNPCRNKKCGHVYEYDMIVKHLKNIKIHKSKSTCPYIGCLNRAISAGFIVKDAALKQRIEAYFSVERANPNTQEQLEIE